MYDHVVFSCLEVTNSDIMLHVHRAVSLVIANGHCHLSDGFVWVCMG